MSARKRKISFESLILRENIIFQVLLSVSKKKKFLTSDCNSSKEYLDRRTERPLLILLLPQIGKFRSSFIERRVVRKKSSISIHHSSNNNFSRMNRRFILFEEERKRKKKKGKIEIRTRFSIFSNSSIPFYFFFFFFDPATPIYLTFTPSPSRERIKLVGIVLNGINTFTFMFDWINRLGMKLTMSGCSLFDR